MGVNSHSPRSVLNGPCTRIHRHAAVGIKLVAGGEFSVQRAPRRHTQGGHDLIVGARFNARLRAAGNKFRVALDIADERKESRRRLPRSAERFNSRILPILKQIWANSPQHRPLARLRPAADNAVSH